MRRVYLYHHPIYRQHDTGPGHPESPERLEAIGCALSGSKLCERLDERQSAPVESRHLLRVHSQRHVYEMMALDGKKGMVDADTIYSPSSLDAALHGSGGVVAAVDRVLADRSSAAFCLARPPGHHAERERAMGFCLFNHVAVAAAYALAEHGLERVLIFDPDVHHGNGTQDIFYENGKVFFVSIHQWPLYPGTGTLEETGLGEGAGRNLNLPLPAGMGDADYLHLVEKVLLPAVRRFRPQLVLISAGFDAHLDDPLGGMNITTAGFREMYRLLMADLDRAEIPAVFTLEGGYSLPALGASVAAVLEMLLDGAEPLEAGEPGRATRELTSQAVRLFDL
jgi:acetoin utilization deacetylase AcuC-like enzyme